MGLTLPTFDADGLRVLTTDEIRDNLRERARLSSDLGPLVSTGIDNLFGITIDLTAAELGEVYELLEGVYAGFVYDNAEQVQLDNLNSLRGVPRNPARPSVSIVTCGGTPATPIPAGSIVATGGGGEQWTTDADADIGGGGTVDVGITCSVAGAVVAGIGAINVIVTGISGWTSVTNAAPATIGEAIETDPDYRVRGDSSSTGSTTEAAIYTRLAALSFIEAAVVTSNRKDATDVHGTLGHHDWIVLHPIISDPDDLQTIAETIWGPAGVAPGIGMRGAVTATVKDINGEEETIAWDWRTALDVYSRVDYKKDGNFPAAGEAMIKAALLAWGSTLAVGQDLNPSKSDAAIVAAVPGITWLASSFRKGASPTYPAYNVPLVTAINELGVLNDGQVTVVDITP